MMAWQNFSRLLNDRSGNFGMMTAILLPVLLGAAGVALDLTNMMVSKTQLQEAADSAALAASTALASGEAADEAAARELAKQFFLGQASNTLGAEAASALAGTLDIDIKTTATATGKKFQVQVGSNYDLALTPLMGVLGQGSMNIATSGTSTSGTEEERSALSMYLALDRSGSMAFVTEQTKPGTCDNYTRNSWPYPASNSPCYVRKIEALQAASAVLFSTLREADPDKTMVRLGATSYTDETQPARAMEWGVDGVEKYVQALPYLPTGGTDANGALKNAWDALKSKNEAEKDAHESKDNDKFDRYILLMTDGEMTGNSSNWNENLDNKVRKKCEEAKKDKITIFSVAFMAPSRGKELLNYCASGAENYFQPETMDDLVAAFEAIGKKAAQSATRLTN
ncbi:vWA domain-containing protein [Pseudorhizobium flavum]|uniref:Flp pilus assembly protein TadG n=1 Tax=Pseudorhizobium flavum TaxID=1335061 RepID=A0A7X0DDB5_9HYPH|nr:TadE/TadG family type IV pilus assembly protein [Pseudorhizobium flavum]MBB6180753.1 Flp pilus assembly protein TadG [Pseudorhizobium flavum]CAD6615261.1 pilus assembly protein TadG [Pseudorhizobium flavum]